VTAPDGAGRRLAGRQPGVAEALADHRSAVSLSRLGIDDEYVLIGPPATLYAHYRLDAAGIAAVVTESAIS